MLFENTPRQLNKIGAYAAIGLAFCIPISTAATTVLLGVILLTWLTGPEGAQKRAILLQHPLVKWIYPIVALAMVGTLYTIADFPAMKAGVMDGLRLLLIPILLFFYQDKDNGRLALWAFVAAMVLTLILAFMKVYGGFPIGLKYTTGAIFKSHIKTSFFMAMAAFFLAQRAQYQPRVIIRAAFWGMAGLMAFYLLFMSIGRIGYIALVTSMLVLAWQWYRLKGVLGALGIAVALITGAYFSSDLFSQRLNLLNKDWSLYQEGGRLEESSLGSRIQFAATSVELIAQRPLTGWGTGSFGQAYANQHMGENTLLTDNPHNEYLRMGAEYGVLGIVFLLCFFYQQARWSAKLPQQDKNFFQGILLIFMVGCLLNSWLKDSTEASFYCLITAVCFAALPLSEKRRQALLTKKVTLH
jgi:O-antigen ligase